MPNTPQPKRGIVTRHTHPQRSLIKRIYVAALLILLPLLMTLFSMLSKNAKSETQYLRKGFALKIAITGWIARKPSDARHNHGNRARTQHQHSLLSFAI